MSESDSDTVITDFRGIHYDMIPMPGDGHCIVHCFSSYFQEWMDQVLDRG